ncbi:Sulfotransferase [Forsythia ovata]|uniref:Sulfotransferase n=1 Tax=Forsythia ovata TaxID=205694 RepID=A0ABD1XBX5_9LAMI
MIEHPNANLRRIAEFLGRPFSNEEEESGMVEGILKLCSFDTLSNLKINRTGKLSSGEENKAFFRQGKVGDWKNHLPIEMAQKLDQITEQKFSGSGLMEYIIQNRFTFQLQKLTRKPHPNNTLGSTINLAKQCLNSYNLASTKHPLHDLKKTATISHFQHNCFPQSEGKRLPPAAHV